MKFMRYARRVGKTEKGTGYYGKIVDKRPEYGTEQIVDSLTVSYFRVPDFSRGPEVAYPPFEQGSPWPEVVYVPAKAGPVIIQEYTWRHGRFSVADCGTRRIVGAMPAETTEEEALRMCRRYLKSILIKLWKRL